MARQNGNGESDIPIQPVESPIICKPYDEPTHYWWYDPKTGEASKLEGRRPAGYWYKTEKVNPNQLTLFAEEQRDDLTLVNLLREDVKRWRGSGYRGASPVTRELLHHWSSADLPRQLFFCQKESVETMIYLAELRIPGKSSRTGFRNFALSEEDLRRLLQGERPSFAPTESIYFPSLIDNPNGDSLRPLRRLGCKMATGSGKTVVMAMLIAWAFCNRGANPNSREYPHGVLVICPNLTVKERLQVLRPESKGNYFEEFDLENWHRFLPESEHKEGDRSYSVVNKGPETPATFARRVLGDLYEQMPIMVLNDEGHHCWRTAPVTEKLTRVEERELEEEKNEARVWLNGLDTLNVASNGGKDGIALCVDLSATPFHLKGSGYPEGSPFPWIVSDFGLVDAIESGIVKIPRLPVRDTTGRPDPKYFKLWQSIREGCSAAEMVGGRSGKPKPEVVYREAQGALRQIAGQWVERSATIRISRSSSTKGLVGRRR
jgi:type III restriction enzyme